MSVLDHAMDNSLAREEHASRQLAGGIANHGYQCGMPWGAALFTGAQIYRQYGSGLQAEAAAILAAQRIELLFRSFTKNKIDCYDMTGLDLTGKIRINRQSLKFLVKGGPAYCARLLAKYSRAIYKEIQKTPPELPNISLSSPVSCSTLLAQKVGSSDIHRIMTAGFAGGIGLSGGGCGALAAAIWTIGMNSVEDQVDKKVGNPKITSIFNRFMENTESKIECKAIVGRKFEDIADHVAYLQGGGCAEIIELLAAETTP
jgi:hypothetical protein